MSNNTVISYRDNGAIAALLDEYERAIKDLKDVLKTIEPAELTTIVDDKTMDEYCRSIQTILSHVVRSGYGYSIYVRKQQGETLNFPMSIFKTFLGSDSMKLCASIVFAAPPTSFSANACMARNSVTFTLIITRCKYAPRNSNSRRNMDCSRKSIFPMPRIMSGRFLMP